MLKENYKAWEIQANSFPQNKSLQEQIEFLLNFAILAPSAHNTQPWKCKTTNNKIQILVHPERTLTHGDTTSRQLYLSLGCFLENLFIAADYFGFSCREELSSYKPENQTINILLDRTGEIKNDPKHLIHTIPQRHSNRYPYLDQTISNDILKELEQISNGQSSVFFVSEKKVKDKIGEIIVNAQVQAMEDVNFRGELSNYLKSNFTKEKFGMPGFTVNMPSIVSLIAPRLVKKINLSKLGAKKDLKLFQKQTPVIGILCTEEDNKESWLQAGQIFEHLWLIATSKGLVCSVWAAAIENENFRSNLKQTLKTEKFPTIVFRIGFPDTKARPSPRFSLKEIIA